MKYSKFEIHHSDYGILGLEIYASTYILYIIGKTLQ